MRFQKSQTTVSSSSEAYREPLKISQYSFANLPNDEESKLLFIPTKILVDTNIASLMQCEINIQTNGKR